MSRKAMVTGIVLLISIWSGSVSWGISASECIEQGRAEMFPCTLSGMRLAYQTFDDCLDDPGCVDCSSNRELIFLHALTQTAMLVVRDNAGEPNSVLEIAKLFGLELLGNDCNNLDYTYPTNEHDYYEIPQGAPDASEISALVKSWMIPEIDEIMAELNSISDLPCDHSFRIYFEPSETGLEGNLEVDYGEVLILKGGLLALRARLQAQAAYDIFVSEDYKLGERIYSGCVDVNDLLNTHPDLFMVLPTANDANDGVAALVQARQDWIDSINYYLDAIDCIRSEDDPPGTDPQDDELVYIDPNDEFFVDTVNGKLSHLRESLVNDTVATYAVETTKTYDVYDASQALIGQLVLVYDFIDAEGEDGSLTFIDGGPAPSPWEVEWHDREETWLEVDVEYYSEGGWREGYFEGTLSPDGSSITNAKFEYWGSDYGTLNNLSGQIVGTEVEYANVDLNPVFGSSSRYPQPVNPRDLLPVFDEWNGPQPDTVGHGLGDDATLGGILPDMTQYDWQVLSDWLQPGGLFFLSAVGNGQITTDGYVNDWTDNQLVLVDICGDTDESVEDLTDNLVGHWKMNDNAENTTVKDSSKNSNDGTTQRNTSVLSTVSKINRALSFYGSTDYISLPDRDEWTFAGDFTIALWAKFNTFNSNWWESAFIGHDEGGGDTNKWIFSYDSTNNYTMFHIKGAGLGPTIIRGNTWTAVAGVWYFVAVSRSGSTWTFYRDGGNDGSEINATAIPNAAAPLTIGWSEGGGKFDGAIDNVMIFDMALSEQEIAALYNAGAGTETIRTAEVEGVDIKELYLAEDGQNLYGAVTFCDNINNETDYWYDLYLSYSPEDSSSPHSIMIDIDVDNGNAEGTLYFKDNDDGHGYWKEVANFNAAAGQNAIEFEIPLGEIAGGLSGRFITIESGGWDPGLREWDGEWNGTHLKIGGTASISGTINYDAYTGAPIFVQAYTELCEPEDSLVACTMITEPGPYTLEGIGLNWQGYVRAFTPLFGFDNPFELEAFDIESSIAVSLSGSNVNGADFVLNDPCLLATDVWVDGEINGELWEEDWYAFDAEQDGVYTLDLTRGTAAYACMSLYGRDGSTELEELYYWQTQQINWRCPVSGRYYVKVANGDYQDGVGTCRIRMCEQCPCIGDLDDNGQVDLQDLDAMVNMLVAAGPPFIVQIKAGHCGDMAEPTGQVDLQDLDALVNLLVNVGPPFIVPCK